MSDFDAVLGALPVPVQAVGDRTWVVRVPTERRGDLPVQIVAGERHVRLSTFVLRGPDQAHAEVYRRLLRRNLDLDVWRFAVDDDRDIYLIAQIDRTTTAAHLDAVLGLLAVTVDQCVQGLIDLGFDTAHPSTASPRLRDQG